MLCSETIFTVLPSGKVLYSGKGDQDIKNLVSTAHILAKLDYLATSYLEYAHLKYAMTVCHLPHFFTMVLLYRSANNC